MYKISLSWLLFYICWPSVQILNPNILLSWFVMDSSSVVVSYNWSFVSSFHHFPTFLWLYLWETVAEKGKKKKLFVMSNPAGDEDCGGSLVPQTSNPHLNCLVKENHLYITFVCCALQQSWVGDLFMWPRMHLLSHCFPCVDACDPDPS